MAAIPTLEEEDAKRPNRERETLVAERTRIINRMKSTLARLGIRTFKPTLRSAEARLTALRTPEGTLLPENMRAELARQLARLRVVRDQVKKIEQGRSKRLEAASPRKEGAHAMVRLLARVIGVGIETSDMLVSEILSRNLRDRRAVARYAGLTGAPDESGSRRREGLGARRERTGTPRHNSTRMAFSRVPEGQRPGALVSRTNDRRASHCKQENDRRTGAQTAHLALARMVTTGELPHTVALRPAS